MTVKNRLKVILAQKNIPQSKLVEDLNINKSTISNIVSGKQNATLDTAIDLAEYLNVRVEDIFYKEREKDYSKGFDISKLDILIDKINKTYKLYEDNVISQDQLINLYKEFERTFKEKNNVLSLCGLFEMYIENEGIEINEIAEKIFLYGVI